MLHADDRRVAIYSVCAVHVPHGRASTHFYKYYFLRGSHTVQLIPKPNGAATILPLPLPSRVYYTRRVYISGSFSSFFYFYFFGGIRALVVHTAHTQTQS